MLISIVPIEDKKIERRYKMKKLIVTLLLVVALAMPCFAEPLTLDNAIEDVQEILAKIPDIKQGIYYDVEENDLEYLSAIEIAKYCNFSLELGYIPNDTLLGIISYPLVKLADFGVELPILKHLKCDLGLAMGVSRIGNNGGNNEVKYGVCVELLDIRW
jgi:hypothetical protein